MAKDITETRMETLSAALMKREDCETGELASE